MTNTKGINMRHITMMLITTALLASCCARGGVSTGQNGGNVSSSYKNVTENRTLGYNDALHALLSINDVSVCFRNEKVVRVDALEGSVVNEYRLMIATGKTVTKDETVFRLVYFVPIHADGSTFGEVEGMMAAENRIEVKSEAGHAQPGSLVVPKP